MKIIDNLVLNRVLKEVEDAFYKSTKNKYQVDIESCKDLKFGDYQCNLALKVAKEIKKNPREIADQVLLILKESSLFENVEVAGPGFINIRISSEMLCRWANLCLKDEHLLVEKSSKEKVIVEFSSPNIAKSMHVGHLRSTIIGESIARLMEFLGYEVLRLNHVGDFGTQFGMLITYMKQYQSKALEKIDDCTLEDLVIWYKEAKKCFDDDENFKSTSQKEVVNLQGGQSQSVAIWKKICEVSRKGFCEIYDLLDVHIEERGESFYNPILKNVVNDFLDKGIAKKDNGALCVFMDGFKNKEGEMLPLIIQKSDGGYNYATTDLAAFRYRVQEDKAKRIIIVTDLGQKMHFLMVSKAAEKVGYIDRKNVQFDHVPFGLVLAPDGKKYKTRSGETEKLSDLLSEAIVHAKSLLDERGIEDNDQIAKILGISAVKYADLSSNRIKDYTFSYERMLRFEGNTASFILYAYVRIQSIKRKCKDVESLINSGEIKITHDSERLLILHMMNFNEILHKMKEDLLPNHLTEYLYHLAEKFNAFFRDCQVVGSEDMLSRLSLCHLAGLHIQKGLYLLGIDTIDRM